MARTPKKQRKDNNNGTAKLILFCGDMVSKVGMSGFALIAVGIAVATWATPQQKTEIIDVYILFKWGSKDLSYLYPTIIAIVGVFIGQRKYYHIKYKKVLSEKDAEIVRISEERSKLQEKIINQPLNHSKEP